MYRTAHLHAYDVLDTIMVTVTITEYGDPPLSGRTALLQWHLSVQGHGDDDPSLWLWRALQLAQEELEDKPRGDPS